MLRLGVTILEPRDKGKIIREALHSDYEPNFHRAVQIDNTEQLPNVLMSLRAAQNQPLARQVLRQTHDKLLESASERIDDLVDYLTSVPRAGEAGDIEVVSKWLQSRIDVHKYSNKSVKTKIKSSY